MIPNCKTRLESGLEDLQNFLGEHEGEEGLIETEEWKAAEALSAEVTAFVETI